MSGLAVPTTGLSEGVEHTTLGPLCRLLESGSLDLLEDWKDQCISYWKLSDGANGPNVFKFSANLKVSTHSCHPGYSEADDTSEPSFLINLGFALLTAKSANISTLTGHFLLP